MNLTKQAPYIKDYAEYGLKSAGLYNPKLDYHDEVAETTEYEYNHCKIEQEQEKLQKEKEEMMTEEEKQQKQDREEEQ